MAEPEVDARAALQALFAASRPRTPQGSSILSESADGESAAQRAGVALRQLFKGDIQKALHPPAAAGRLKEIEGHVGKLLEQVSPGAKFRPPPRARPLRSKNGIDVEVQTAVNAVPKRLISEPTMPVPAPDPDEGKPRHRCCVIQDNSEAAEIMRKKVREAQKRLHDLDFETTTLTREVKMLRIAHWEKQRIKCAKEREVDDFFARHANELRRNGLATLEQEELAKKQAELCTAKQQAKHWSRQARRLDVELQQQFRGGGDVQRILSKHPAGEVFLPPMGPGSDSDDGSEDEYYRDARMPEVQLASSDDDSPKGSGGGRPLSGPVNYYPEQSAPPPPPSQQWRSVNTGDADGDASEGSSVTSPSGESGGVPSPTGASRSRLAGGPSVLGKPRSDTESDSDSEDAGKKDWRASPKGQKSTTVPPLPELSGLHGNAVPPTAAATAPKAAPAAAKAAAELDVAEEVSSEDIWSQDGGDESSRSV